MLDKPGRMWNVIHVWSGFQTCVSLDLLNANAAEEGGHPAGPSA